MTPGLNGQWRQIASKQIQTVAELEALVFEWTQRWPEHALILLQGPMAVGKTEFVKCVLKTQNQKQRATSPTFTLHQTYTLGEKQIEHWDLYRLSDPEELESAGFWDQFADQEPRWVFVEWSDRINDKNLPLDWPIFLFSMSQEGQQRRIVISERS